MSKLLLALCACAALSACQSSAADLGEEVENTTQQLKKKEWNMPVQAEGLAKHGAPPTQTGFNMPPLRKATRDEVEELNSTYRTAGSRAKMLARIARAQAAGDAEAVRSYAGVLDKAIEKLPAAEQAQARNELQQRLERSGGER